MSYARVHPRTLYTMTNKNGDGVQLYFARVPSCRHFYSYTTRHPSCIIFVATYKMGIYLSGKPNCMKLSGSIQPFLKWGKTKGICLCAFVFWKNVQGSSNTVIPKQIEWHAKN